MLKWRYQPEEPTDERMSNSGRLTRNGRRRKVIGRESLRNKVKLLEQTITAQKTSIETLLSEKGESIGQMEKVMEEFIRLDKEISRTENQLTYEKIVNEDLRGEIEYWKTECSNYKLGCEILQGEIQRASRTGIVRNNILKEADDIDIGGKPKEQNSDQDPADESYQNWMNESRLEEKDTTIMNVAFIKGANATKPSPDCPAEIFLASDFRRDVQSRATQCPETTVHQRTRCLRRFIRYVKRNKKVASS